MIPGSEVKHLMAVCIQFQWFDRNTKQDFLKTGNELVASIAPAAEYIGTKVEQLCQEITLNPPEKLKNQLVQLQDQVIIHISIDFFNDSGDIANMHHME